MTDSWLCAARQGDMLLAEELNRICSAKMVACFMHQVGPLEETATKLRANKDSEPSSWPNAWRQQRIFVAPDYISLAAQVYLVIDQKTLFC